MNENEAPVRVGDLVMLASGGPWMTVRELRDDGLVECVWFADRELFGDAFAPEELRVEFYR